MVSIVGYVAMSGDKATAFIARSERDYALEMKGWKAVALTHELPAVLLVEHVKKGDVHFVTPEQIQQAWEETQR